MRICFAFLFNVILRVKYHLYINAYFLVASLAKLFSYSKKNICRERTLQAKRKTFITIVNLLEPA